MGSPCKHGILEVERKFSNLRVHPLLQNGGKPQFQSLIHVGRNKFIDTYFDSKDQLCRAGTWVRNRSGKWEAKIRQAGDYNSSQFKELQDVEEIRSHITSTTGLSQSPSADFGLPKMAQITTHRESWLADDRFKIVLDCTDFGHVVGEVELESIVATRNNINMKETCKEMDSEILSFMQRYSWTFDTSPPVGKLTAYFARQQLRSAS